MAPPLHEIVARITQRAQALESAADEARRELLAALRADADAALRLSELPGHKSPLSRRQTEVLTLAAKGLGNLEIARVLALSLGTVRTHLEQVFLRLEVTNRVEAVTEGLRLGLFEP